jgi:hypothetical protein
MSYQSSYVAIPIRHAKHVSHCTLVTMIPTTTLLALHHTLIAQILVATTCLLKLLYIHTCTSSPHRPTTWDTISRKHVLPLPFHSVLTLAATGSPPLLASIYIIALARETRKITRKREAAKSVFATGVFMYVIPFFMYYKADRVVVTALLLM